MEEEVLGVSQSTEAAVPVTGIGVSRTGRLGTGVGDSIGTMRSDGDGVGPVGSGAVGPGVAVHAAASTPAVRIMGPAPRFTRE